MQTKKEIYGTDSKSESFRGKTIKELKKLVRSRKRLEKMVNGRNKKKILRPQEEEKIKNKTL